MVEATGSMPGESRARSRSAVRNFLQATEIDTRMLGMIGALLEETRCLDSSTAVKLLKTKVKNRALLEIDVRALAAGRDVVAHDENSGPVSQPDGFAF